MAKIQETDRISKNGDYTYCYVDGKPAWLTRAQIDAAVKAKSINIRASADGKAGFAAPNIVKEHEVKDVNVTKEEAWA